MGQRILLACGIAAPALYVAADLFAVLMLPGQGFAAHRLGERLALAAPARPFLLAQLLLCMALVVAFGIGVRALAAPGRPLRWSGALLMAFGVAGLAAPLLYPAHGVAAVAEGSDARHVVVTLVPALLALLTVGFGSGAFGQGFRRYSVATMLVVVGFGCMAGMYVPSLAPQAPARWLGVWERLNVYAMLLWVLVLAVRLLRTQPGAAVPEARGS